MAITLEQAAAAQLPLPPASERRQSQGPAETDSAPQTGAQVIICPRCQAPNFANQRFCSSCGLPFGGPRVGQASAHLAALAPAAPAQIGAVVCPSCQAPNGPLDRFCTRCGYNMLRGVPGRKCHKCGVVNTPGTRFCTTCGATLS